jgi:hypothetical protein
MLNFDISHGGSSGIAWMPARSWHPGFREEPGSRSALSGLRLLRELWLIQVGRAVRAISPGRSSPVLQPFTWRVGRALRLLWLIQVGRAMRAIPPFSL